MAIKNTETKHAQVLLLDVEKHGTSCNLERKIGRFRLRKYEMNSFT